MRTLFDIYSTKIKKWREQSSPSRDKVQREIYQESQERIEKLKTMTALIVQELIDENIPIDEYSKIDMEWFIKKTPNDEKFYGSNEVKKDKREANDRLKQWGKASGLSDSLFPQQFEEERLKRLIGEQFEVLTFILLYKFLQEHFIVVRASLHDDHKNRIDLLLIDKTTGAVICAVNTVADDSPDGRLQIKAENLWKINTEENGVNLKYGLSLENGRLILKKFHNLPIFYFALNKEEVKKYIDELNPALNKTSNLEDNLFRYFMELLVKQIEELDKFVNLNKNIYSHLEETKKSLKKITGPLLGKWFEE